MSENENTTYQNIWDVAQAVFREKFIAENIYIKGGKKSSVSNLIIHWRNKRRVN